MVDRRVGRSQARLSAVSLAPTVIDVAVLRLERWLEGMRSPAGYGGPVVHFWRDNVLFCAPAIGWRYEGIVVGYLTLHRAAGDAGWLAKAKRAGEDILAGRLPGGTFRNSGFELNPVTGGTPHEAAVDCALLMLARCLRDVGDSSWRTYFEAADENVERLLIGRLWRAADHRFGDGGNWFVPNKAATIIEALCLHAELSGSDEHLVRYARPTADAILDLQVRDSGGPLDGGIVQAHDGKRPVEQYFPYYVARAVPGLLMLASATGEERYRDAAVAAGRFLARRRDADGAYPQLAYRGRRANRYPRWVAGSADIVRAVELLRQAGADADPGPTLDWLVAGQLAGGNFRIADGFAAQINQRVPAGPPDARDFMPVVGWNDKAFRVLAARYTGAEVPPAATEPAAAEHEVVWRGRRARLTENGDGVEIVSDGRVVYRWRKGADWASIA